MTPIFVIKVKMHQCLKRAVIIHCKYDKAQVVDDGLLVHVQYDSAAYIVVTPRGNKFGGKIVVKLACHFSDEG